MKIQIKSEKENPYLNRKELLIEIEHPSAATPAKAALQHFMAAELKKEIGQIDIKSIFSSFGKNQSEAKIFVWKDKRVPDLATVVKEKKEKKEEPKPPKKEEPKKEPEKKSEEKKEPAKKQ